jgi:hypothetical protein
VWQIPHFTESVTYPLHKACLLTEIGDSRSIVVGEHFISENGVRDLGSVHQVHFQQSGLKTSLLGLILLERIQEEGCRLLNQVLGHEDVDNL